MRNPNKFEVKGNPSIWVTILRRGRKTTDPAEWCWHYVFWRNGKRHRGSTGTTSHTDALTNARAVAEKTMSAVQTPQRIVVDCPDFPCVYFIQAVGGHDFIKIGFTESLEARIRAIQTSCPLNLRVLCVAAGLRPIGTVRLKWSDVNFETGKIRVYEKRRERRIKVNKWILSELKAWKKTSAGDHVVDLKDRTIHHWMNKIRKEQRLRPEATLQGCRRTFISNGMDAGISSEIMASYGGTSGRTMERHYKDLRTMKSDHLTDMFNYSGALRVTKSIHSKNHSKKTG